MTCRVIHKQFSERSDGLRSLTIRAEKTISGISIALEFTHDYSSLKNMEKPTKILSGRALHQWLSEFSTTFDKENIVFSRKDYGDIAGNLVMFDDAIALDFIRQQVEFDVAGVLASGGISLAMPSIAGHYAVIVGVSTVEAGWICDFPEIQVFDELASARKFFDLTSSAAQRAFQSDIEKNILGLLSGSLTPTDPQIYTAWLIKKLDDGVVPILGEEITWYPELEGFGRYERAEFDPETIFTIEEYLGESW